MNLHLYLVIAMPRTDGRAMQPSNRDTAFKLYAANQQWVDDFQMP
jgi:hypothetical protein